MNPSTKLTVAALLSAAGAFLNALADEFSGDVPEGHPITPEPAPTPKKTTKKATAAEPESKKEEKTPEPEEKKEEQVGKTYEELRALIEPLVKGGQGEDVKKVIAKYSDAGLKGMEAKHHAAFEKDIQALSY